MHSVLPTHFPFNSHLCWSSKFNILPGSKKKPLTIKGVSTQGSWFGRVCQINKLAIVLKKVEEIQNEALLFWNRKIHPGSVLSGNEPGIAPWNNAMRGLNLFCCLVGCISFRKWSSQHTNLVLPAEMHLIILLCNFFSKLLLEFVCEIVSLLNTAS